MFSREHRAEQKRKKTALAQSKRERNITGTVQLNKTAYGTSEDEGGLWNVGDGCWEGSREWIKSVGKEENGNGKELRHFYLQMKRIIILKREQTRIAKIQRDISEERTQQKQQELKNQANETPPIALSPVVVTTPSASTEPPLRCLSRGRSISSCRSKTSFVDPPSISTSSVASTPHYSSCSSNCEYKELQNHYSARIKRMYQLHNPDKLRDLPAILIQFEGYLDQVLRTLVEKYGSEPGHSRVTIDYFERLKYYIAEVAPPLLPKINQMLETHIGKEEYMFLQLYATSGMRETVAPEIRFPVSNYWDIIEDTYQKRGTSEDLRRLPRLRQVYESREDLLLDAVKERFEDPIPVPGTFNSVVSHYLSTSSPGLAADNEYLDILSGLFKNKPRACILKLAAGRPATLNL